MNPIYQQQSVSLFQIQPIQRPSNPLQCIKTIEQSMLSLKSKINQMQRKQSQNNKQIEKVFYASIPLIQNKFSQCDQYQKFIEKKRSVHNQGVAKQLQQLNRERKMINQKQIQRNRELMNIMKINQHHSIKQLSKKNDKFIQKMKNQRIQQNKRKRELVKNQMQKSRSKVIDFHIIKKEDLKKQKQQQKSLLQKKVYKMIGQLQKLNNKQNNTLTRVEKSSEALRHIRFAVNKLQKMNQTDFIKIKQKVVEGEDDKQNDNKESHRSNDRNLSQNNTNKEQIIRANSNTLLQKHTKTSYGHRIYSNHINKNIE